VPQKKEKKETTAKHKPTWNYRSGWPNKYSFLMEFHLLWGAAASFRGLKSPPQAQAKPGYVPDNEWFQSISTTDSPID